MRLLIKEREPTAARSASPAATSRRSTHRKVPYYRRNIGVVFQDFKLLPEPDGLRQRRLRAVGDRRARASEIRDKVPDILRLTGLSTKLHNYPDQLSGGEQQRVSVARAFVNHPPLLLADEPTGNLDPTTSIGIMQLLYRINRTGTTVSSRPTTRTWSTACAAASSSSARARIVRDEASGLYAQREQTTDEFGQLLTRAELDRLDPMRLGFFLHEATRSLKRNAVPSFAAMASVLVTVLVLGVFIPIVQATTGAANEVREQGARRRLPQERRQARGRRSASAAR